jgi:hypothetical protein
MPTYYPQLSHRLQGELTNEFNQEYPDYLTVQERLQSARDVKDATENISKWLYFWHIRKPVIRGDHSRAPAEQQIRLNICEHACDGIIASAQEFNVTVAMMEVYIAANIINSPDGSVSLASLHIVPPEQNKRKIVMNYSNSQKRSFLVERNLYSYRVSAYFKDAAEPQRFQFECPRDASEEDFMRQIFYNVAENLANLTKAECSQEFVDKDSDFSPFFRNKASTPVYIFTSKDDPERWYHFWHRFTALLANGEALSSPKFQEITRNPLKLTTSSQALLMSPVEDNKVECKRDEPVAIESATIIARKLKNMRKRNKAKNKK